MANKRTRPFTEAQAKANDKYIKSQDSILLRYPASSKGIIADFAKSKSLSVNSYIKKLIEADMGMSIEQAIKEKEEKANR